MKLTLRNAPFAELVTELREQQDRKVDLIVPAADLWSNAGFTVVRGMGPNVTMTEEGVGRDNLVLSPSDVFDNGLSSKLSQPGRPLSRAYLRGLRETGRTDLVDANVNGLLHGNKDLGVPGDPRRFLIRTFTGADGHTGYARALLSDSYKTIDNWDVLQSVMQGMTSAGLDSHVVRSADLTNDRMYIKIVVPEIAVLAPELLKDYVSPYSRNKGADNPTVFAGMVISNSDTGGGALTIKPCLEIEICTNGMTITQDVVRDVHLGGKLKGEGVVQYGEDTEASNLKTIMLKTRDTVKTFLNEEYMIRAIDSLTHQAGEPLSSTPAKVIEVVTKRAAFSKSDADGILDAFMRGGQVTKGGVVQAVTAYSQTIGDADKAYAMDADAFAAAGITGVTGLVPA